MSQAFGTAGGGATDVEMRFLVQDVSALLDYLVRAVPDRLAAALGGAAAPEFTAAGKRLCALLGPVGGAEDNGVEPCRRYLAMFAVIADYWSGKPGEAERVPTSVRDASVDWAWLQISRSALGELVAPASLDTILVTRSMLLDLAGRAVAPGLFRRAMKRNGGAGHGGAGAHDAGPQQVPIMAGYRLARHVRRIRMATVALTLIVVALSVFVGAGKTLVDERARQEVLLQQVHADIQRDVDLQAARVVPPGESNAGVEGLKQGRMIHDRTLTYCDQPYRDHNGLVRYATAAQPINCERLWGVNRSVGQTTLEMAAWMGLVLPDDDNPSMLAKAYAVFRRVWTGSRTADRITPTSLFPEAARSMTRYDAFQVALRECLIRQDSQTRTLSINAPAGQDAPPAPEPAAGPQPCTVEHAAAQATQMVPDGAARVRELPMDIAGPERRAIRAKIVIESFSLYLLPVIFALLGSLVALNRNLRRLSDQWLLTPSERARGNTSLVLGAAFGAIVSLLAEVLRSAGTAAQPGSTTATGVALGLWPLAFLAGYSVTHVFRMLDSAVDRVFGAPPAR